MMSTPNASWRPTTVSGVRKWLEPSRCDRKVTPCLGDGAQGRQAEDLVAAGVGEDGAVPVHEAVQPPQGLDGRNPGPQVEVVGVA